ncbi:periplasmic heavy metal sensor [Lentibacter algarum]|uniref:periplasmic heavy metal sensor n=1 Tax=Lentibacter algarum TaxID=576131 RepID=UPI001C08E8A9|nr:periplasmic heavy metal sensor [Lentibacter algarum]MBU2982919.1 periplasmic heavy metal sensor [Lentibacter algarum]
MTQDMKTNDGSETGGKSRMSRGWRAVLVVSLGLNLAVAGLVVGAAYRYNGPPHNKVSREDPILRALDKDARREIGRAMRKNRAGAPGIQQEIAAGFANMQTALRADEFDAVAFRAAMARKGAAFREMRAVGETALVDYISGLSKVQRTELANRLKDDPKRRKNR